MRFERLSEKPYKEVFGFPDKMDYAFKENAYTAGGTSILAEHV